jgi:hypothetical protein
MFVPASKPLKKSRLNPEITIRFPFSVPSVNLRTSCANDRKLTDYSGMPNR